ncbi:MAG: diguanylate cyclase [Actinobacteria bacterium]|nr:diguanylate cyclase [Actinomycetota bacterium]
MSRLTTAGLVAVLAFLTGFAIWAARTTASSADAVRRSSDLSSIYDETRRAVAAEDSWVTEYLLRLGPESVYLDARKLRRGHAAAARSLVGTLRSARREDAGGTALNLLLLKRHSAYVEAAERLFDAVDAGRPGLALAIKFDEIQPRFSRIEEGVERLAVAHRREGSEHLDDLNGSQQLVLRATPIAFGAGLLLLIGFFLLLRNLQRRLETAREEEIERLGRAALTDNLTGLRNHRAFQEDVARELLRAGRTGTALSLVVLDLDDLKQVNDALGHQAGDEQLKALADAALSTVRGSDAAYRLGGDEFALVLPGEQAWAALRAVQRLQATLEAAGCPNSRPTCTAGIAQSDGLVARDTLLRRADLALLEAKRSHRQTLIYSDELAPRVLEPDRVASEHHTKTLATALARAVDAKDSYTRSHCETVSELCALIACELGLDDDRAARLRLAGLLHDVGKIGIPDAVLQKPASLTDEEFELMKTHVTLGHSIVSGAELDQEAEWILHHHERLDGRGYPDGLPADDLPLESRIILVADAFEAITTDRPYREARSESQALAELEEHAGSQFDPDCVAALRRALHGSSSPAVEQLMAAR